jgi:hypothetical protein
MAGQQQEWSSDVPLELRHLIATNRAAEDVLANRHALVEVDRRRQSMRTAARGIEKGSDDRVTLLTGSVMLNLPKQDVQSILKKGEFPI